MRGKIVLLIALDLSSAFDTVDFTILLSILEHRLGIKGTVLKFFTTYLHNRKTRVVIENKWSGSITTHTGVPQSSILGPVLFTVYLIPLFDFLDGLNIYYHFYADDSQLLFEFNNNQSEISEIVGKISSVFESLKLKINQEKTEVIFLKSKRSTFRVPSEIDINDTKVKVCAEIRLLGITLDGNFNYATQVNKVCKQCYIQLRKLYSIRKHVKYEQRKELATCFILSALDYCNSIYIKLDKGLLRKLQRIQNSAARFVCGYTSSKSATELLKKLHWLPVDFRISYNILCMMHKVNSTTAPSYLLEFFSRSVTSSHPKRKELFRLPKCKSEITKRSFSYQGAKQWNELPEYLRQTIDYSAFKKCLKTHLFCQAF